MRLHRLLLPCIVATTLSAGAVPAKRTYFSYPQPDGSIVTAMPVGDEYGHYYLSTDGRPMLTDADGRLYFAGGNAAAVADSIALQATRLRKERASARLSIAKRHKAPTNSAEAPQYGLGLFSDIYPSIGEVKSLVFLVEYQDVRFTVPDAHDFYDRQLNEEGFSDNRGTGSARDYFIKQSGGLFRPQFDVYGPVLLPENMSHYGANDFRGDDRFASDMIKHAAAILADDIDFSKYDYDNDGYVDNIYVIYAGYGENNGGVPSSVWPHSADISNGPVYNGKQIHSYACSNEISDGEPDGIGTFCHEYSHVLGLPDLYSTSSNLRCTPRSWDLMDSGSYNNDGRTPPNYSSFERNALGWMKPAIVKSAENGRLTEIGESNFAYLIPASKTNEFYLLENRQKTGWDKYIPGHGMLIWHIDFNEAIWKANSVNNLERHQYVDIIEASGTTGSTESAMAGYSFPGTSGNTSFTPETKPAMIDWSGYESDFPVTEIAEDATGTVTFKIAGGIIVFDKPEAPVLNASDNGILTIEWEALPQAASYDICIYTKDIDGKDKQFAGYTDFNVGDVLKYEIEGMQSETEYFARVRGRSGSITSEYSDEGSVRTPEIDFIYTAPVAEDCAFNGTTATLTWLPLPGAENYLVTVEKESENGKDNIVVGFGDNDKEISLPERWTWNERLSDCYGSAATGYFGTAAPSVKFPNNQSAMETCLYDNDLKEMSFWFRTASANTKSKFHIEGRRTTNAPYDTIMTIDGLNTYNAGGRTIYLSQMPEGIRQIRFVYERSSGFAIIDDIKLSFPAFVFEPVAERADAGNTVSFDIDFPADATGLRFYVEGVDGNGRISRRSNLISARNNSQSGVTPPLHTSPHISIVGNCISYNGAPGSAVTVHTPAGITVAVLSTGSEGTANANLEPGLYIVSTPEGTVKIAVK